MIPFLLHPRLPADFLWAYTTLISPRGEGVCDEQKMGLRKRLMRMSRWMGLHFYDWIDYNGVAFSIQLLERGRTFSGFFGSKKNATVFSVVVLIFNNQLTLHSVLKIAT